MSERMTHLLSWLDTCGFKVHSELSAIPGDAGARCYLRFQAQQGNWVVMIDKEESFVSYLKVHRQLQAIGLPVAELKNTHTKGLLVQEDLGKCSVVAYYAQGNQLAGYYTQALTQLLCFQTKALDLPRYTQAMLWQECQLLPQWWAEKMCGSPLNTLERQVYHTICRRLVGQALTQPQVPVHRDYHSRNLMMHKDTLFWIDFQDACIGPLLYDVVSLTQDTTPAVYQVRSTQTVMDAVAVYYQQLCTQTTYVDGVSWAQFMQWYDWIGLQRHLKVLGIFARLALRDDKPEYLAQHQQALLESIADICQRYDFLRPLLPILQARTSCVLSY